MRRDVEVLTGRRLEGDDVFLAEPVRGDGDALAVDGHVAVADQLAGLAAAGAPAGTEDDVVEAQLVTNAEFRCFWEAGGYGRIDDGKPNWWSSEGWRWRAGEWEFDLSIYPEDLRRNVQRWLARRPSELRDHPFFWDDPDWNALNLPVVGLSWFECEAYCNWLKAMTGQPFGLPSEAEWEKAARGIESNLWPWGNKWDANKCNNTEPDDHFGRTTPVGMYPDGASPFGGLDMVGNTWEWCFDWYSGDEYQRQKENPQPVLDPSGLTAGQAWVVRGGSWHTLSKLRPLRLPLPESFLASLATLAGFGLFSPPGLFEILVSGCWFLFLSPLWGAKFCRFMAKTF